MSAKLGATDEYNNNTGTTDIKYTLLQSPAMESACFDRKNVKATRQ